MKKILIVVDTSRGPGREFLGGIEDYIGTGADWEVSVPPPKYLNDQTFNLNAWCYLQEPDGLIVFGYYRLNKLLKLDARKVVMHHAVEQQDDTAVLTADSVAIAKMAAGYLKNLGHTRFAYCSCVDLPWSQTRKEIFEEAVALFGGAFDHYHFQLTSRDDINQVRRDLANWISSLPKPIALFVCNDDIAVFVLEACKLNAVKVPDEVAVLGVDNDELVCRLSTPSLSSIELDFRQCGFKASQRLSELIEGKPDRQKLMIAPVRVVTRESTDSLAVEDEAVREALVFIRKNYQKKIAVSDVVEYVSMSRNALENKFQACLKKTIAEELSRLRIDMIKDKLLNLNISINNIGSSLEFTSPEHFSRYFKKAVGLTPNQFRKKYRSLD